jgi:hypothetical protein
MQQFVVYGRPIIIGRMKALAVIKDFNILKHSLLELISGLIGLVVHQLSFQGMEEAFRNAIDAPSSCPYGSALPYAMPG